MRASLDRLKAVVLYLEGKDLCHQSPALGSAVNIVDILVDRASVLPDLSAMKMLRGDRFTAKLAPWFLSERSLSSRMRQPVFEYRARPPRSPASLLRAAR